MCYKWIFWSKYYLTYQVDRSLDGEVLEGAEVVAAVVEGGLAFQHLVSDEKPERYELGAVAADVDDLAPVALE